MRNGEVGKLIPLGLVETEINDSCKDAIHIKKKPIF